MTVDTRPHVLFVCTGNAARSVMAATMARARSEAIEVTGAGTHSIPGLPMSTRTRNALALFELADPSHRSNQLDDAMADAATLIAVFEPMHIIHIRREHPQAAARTASLPRLAAELAPGPSDRASVAGRVAALDLASVAFEAWEEVVDPAGGEAPEFEAAARQIDGLIDDLLVRLGTGAS